MEVVHLETDRRKPGEGKGDEAGKKGHPIHGASASQAALWVSSVSLVQNALWVVPTQQEDTGVNF